MYNIHLPSIQCINSRLKSNLYKPSQEGKRGCLRSTMRGTTGRLIKEG